jgi:uncharacterized protein (DUF1697 family)
MTTFVALLRAVNVGGTGKLKMTELVALCEGLGFSNVKTYIQSGNVVLRSGGTEAEVKGALEEALAGSLGQRVGVLVRRGADLDRLVADNPFPAAPPNKVIAVFYDEPLALGALVGVKAPGGEELVAHGRELYVHFPNGQGRSKLKVPLADRGTGRNLNTVSKLAEMARTLG